MSHTRSTFVPLSTVLLGLGLAGFSGSRWAHSLRAPAGITGEMCHVFLHTPPDPLCVGQDAHDGAVGCDFPDPQTLPGRIGESRETQERSEFGHVRHTMGALGGGRVGPGAFPQLPAVPVRARIHKQLRLQGRPEDCKTLPHQMESKAACELRIRILATPPLRPGDAVGGSGTVTARADRSNDAGLNENDWMTLSVFFTRLLSPQGNLFDSDLTVLNTKGQPVERRRARRFGPNVRTEPIAFEALAEATHAFNRRADVDYRAAARAIRLKAADNVPAGDPDDAFDIRAQIVAEVRDPVVVLKDLSEGIGN